MTAPLRGVRGRLYAALTALIKATGRPGINPPQFPNGAPGARSCRYVLRFGRLKLIWSCYNPPARPHGGESHGVVESVWIYTKKHARGVGVVRPWARLMNIDLELSGARYSTEDGRLDLTPPHQTRFIRIHNTGQLSDATVDLRVWTGAELTSTLCVGGMVHSIRPNTSATFLTETCETVASIRYATIPEVETKLRRLFGRPEWE